VELLLELTERPLPLILNSLKTELATLIELQTDLSLTLEGITYEMPEMPD
jgi:hypothetical protein